ncbi:hypothetical protein [Kitasatospora sp. CB01950]|uniref:hypothetical protein n=1 Tax=Kitasatospora sp. CB01950 TaxID=1703930 RepID=UPI00116152C2|nr:hypothetical protein [Kitasatospora sp. CB01950]
MAPTTLAPLTTLRGGSNVICGRMVLDSLLPTARRRRVKARSRKNPTGKYGPNAGEHPQTAQTYALSVEIHVMEDGLASRLPVDATALKS